MRSIRFSSFGERSYQSLLNEARPIQLSAICYFIFVEGHSMATGLSLDEIPWTASTEEKMRLQSGKQGTGLAFMLLPDGQRSAGLSSLVHQAEGQATSNRKLIGKAEIVCLRRHHRESYLSSPIDL